MEKQLLLACCKVSFLCAKKRASYSYWRICDSMYTSLVTLTVTLGFRQSRGTRKFYESSGGKKCTERLNITELEYTVNNTIYPEISEMMVNVEELGFTLGLITFVLLHINSDSYQPILPIGWYYLNIHVAVIKLCGALNWNVWLYLLFFNFAS